MNRIVRKFSGKPAKRGSWIVEAAITLPVFIIAILVMSSVILMYACIEEAHFIAANEMRRGAAEAYAINTSVLIPRRIKSELTESRSQVKSIKLRDYGYRTSAWGQDELIAIRMEVRMNTPNPLGIKAEAKYDLALVTRAFVGKKRSCESMTDDEMSGAGAEPVFIFPKRGEKYHREGCTFLRAASTSGALTSGIRSKYAPCPICGSRNAADGTLVYYFPAAGESYHLRNCPSLQRHYVEIDKKDAVSRGYTPCSKCGG